MQTTEKKPLKRNDVVMPVEGSWRFYGRINRILPDGRYEVIDCGKYITAYHGHELEVHNDYKGRWTTWGKRQWVRMPSLRKLKQITAWYNKAAWKRYREA